MANFTASPAANVTVVPPPARTSDGICPDWEDAQHILFQLANLCFALSFLTPSHLKYHLFFLRSVVSLGSLFLVVWSSTVVCHMDVLFWYLLFLVINIAHILYMVYRIYPVQFPQRYLGLYTKLFEPLAVSRLQFKELASQGQLQLLKAGEVYAQERTTPVGEKVAALVSGKLLVQCDNMFLHHIQRNQFIDSPEFKTFTDHSASAGAGKFQVTVSAAEDSTLLVWPAEVLRHFLHARPFMEAVFTHVLGRDITTKLYQVQEFILSQPDYEDSRARRRNSLVHFRHRLSRHLAHASPSEKEDEYQDGSCEYNGTACKENANSGYMRQPDKSLGTFL